MAIPDTWVIEALQRRLDWLVARAAIRENDGKDACYDDLEAAALRRALSQFRPDSAIAKMRVELDDQQRKIQQQRLAMRRKDVYIERLKKALGDAGVTLPPRDKET